tara:strand:+ start:557 stop:1144 length:588 start_codon:yes stop_codon:yes gene_type:complete
LVNSNSIFSAYSKALESLDCSDEDIVIMCHDDIEIVSTEQNFLNTLIQGVMQPQTGFIGPAGTTELTEDAVWWNKIQWQQMKHRGFVFHGKGLDKNPEATFYGQYGQVAVLDGVFQAAQVKTLKKVGLDKPDYLEGDWDYYDIHYTHKAHSMGLKNHAVPILLLHNSVGSIDRSSWNQNREAFIKKHKNKFPIKI